MTAPTLATSRVCPSISEATWRIYAALRMTAWKYLRCGADGFTQGWNIGEKA